MAEHRVVYRLDRDGKWLASVRGIRRCQGCGRTIREARRQLRASLAKRVLDPYEIDFAEDVRLPKPARALLVAHWRARRQKEIFAKRSAEASRRALLGLQAIGIKLKDAADLLGIPPLKLQKLLKTGEPSAD
jgi:hypothetical protein